MFQIHHFGRVVFFGLLSEVLLGRQLRVFRRS